MSVEKELALRLILRAGEYNKGMGEANKGLQDFKKGTESASQTVKGFEQTVKGAGKGLSSFEDGTTGAARGAKKVEKATQEAKDALKALQGEVSRAKKELDSLGKQQAKTGDESKKLAEELKAARKVLTDLETAGHAAAKGLKEVEKANAQAAEKLEGTRHKLEQTNNKLVETREAVGKASDALKAYAAHNRNTQTASDDVAVSIGKVAKASDLLNASLQAVGIGIAAKSMFDFAASTVRANTEIQTLRGSIGAIVSANQTVKDSNGHLVQGVEKIKAVQEEVSGLFAEIQLDAMKTSDTTQGLIDKLSNAIGPGMNAGMNLKQIKDLTVSASVAMSALNIKSEQSASEIRALFTGDELDNAQLAKGLGFNKKSDIQALITQGKLYDVLMKKMADFRAAGELQSQTLPGVVSSLEDLRNKFLQIMGSKATDTLTEGLNEFYHSIQKSDGGLTAFGRELGDLSTFGGLVLNDLSNAFIETGNVALQVGVQIGKMLKDSYIGLKSLSAEAGARSAVEGPIIQARDRVGVIDDTLARPSWFFGPKDDKEKLSLLSEKAKLNAQINYHGAHPEAAQAKIDAAATAEISETLSALTGAKPIPKRAAPAGKYTFKNNKVNNTDPAKAKAAAKAAEQKDKSAVTQLMADMRNEEQRSDAKEFGLSGKLAIEEKYIKLLGKHKTATEELRSLEFDKEITLIELGKKRIKIEEDKLKVQENVKKIEAQSGTNIQQTRIDAFLENYKRAQATSQNALRSQFDQGNISPEQYTTRLQALKDADIKVQYQATETGYENQRQVLEDQLKTALSRKKGVYGQPGTYNAEEVAGLQATLKELEAKTKTLPSAMGAELKQNADDAAQFLGDATRTQLSNGLVAAFSLAGPDAAKLLTQNVQKNLVQMLQGTSSPASSFIKALGAPGVADDIANTVNNINEVIDRVQSGTAARKTINANLDTQARSFYAPNRSDDQRAINNQIAEMRKAIKDANGKGKMLWDNTDFTPEQLANLATIQKGLENNADRSERGRTNAKADIALNRGVKSEQDKQKLAKASGYLYDDTAEQNLIKAEQTRLREQMKGLEQYSDEWTAAENRIYDLQNNLDDMALGHKLENIQAEETARLKLIDKMDAEQEASTQKAIGALRQLQIEASKAIDNKSDDRLNLAKYGLDSATLAQFQTIQAKIQADKDTINRTSTSNTKLTTQQSALFAEFTKNNPLRMFNGTANDMPIAKAGTGVNYAANPDGIDFSLSEFAKWINQGLTITNRVTGKKYTSDDLLKARSTLLGIPGQINANNTDQATANTDITEQTKQLNALFADVRANAGSILKDTELEKTQAKAALDPTGAAQKQAQLASIDKDFNDRIAALFQSGVLTDIVAPEDQTKIRANLEQIRDYMKQQVTQQSYTDVNPLPVKVVELPQAFALPTSAYFRGENRPSITLSSGAIQVNGSNLTQAQLTDALTGVITNLGGPLATVVNRENSIQGAQMTV